MPEIFCILPPYILVNNLGKIFIMKSFPFLLFSFILSLGTSHVLSIVFSFILATATLALWL